MISDGLITFTGRPRILLCEVEVVIISSRPFTVFDLVSQTGDLIIIWPAIAIPECLESVGTMHPMIISVTQEVNT